MSVEITQIQRMRKFLLIPLALCGLPATGFGQSVEDLASVTVLPGWRDADGTHVTALRIDLAEGWKTYWRAPGDSGIPPSFAFSGGDITAVQPHFPVLYRNHNTRVAHECIVDPRNPARLRRVAGQVRMTVRATTVGCCWVCCVIPAPQWMHVR